MKKRRSTTPLGLTSIENIMHGKNGMPSVIDSPSATVETLQYDLWTTFFGADKDVLSNSVEFWDAMPKFSVHRNKQIELRNEFGGLGIYRSSFIFGGSKYEMALQPALISEGGEDIAYYPSGDEDLVWEVLIKAFSDQNYGFHDLSSNPPRSFVRFSLRMIQRELGRYEHKRSLAQIRHAIEVLSRSILIVSKEGKNKKPLYRAPILADVLDITRDDYLNDPSKYWVARLPALVSASLSSLDYRQYNYTKALAFKFSFSRWLQKRLTHRFKHADIFSKYNMALSTIREESCFFQNERVSRQIRQVDKTLEELVKASIITSYTKDIQRGEGRGRPIKEVVWNLSPHPFQINEAKAANARLTDSKKRIALVSSRGKNKSDNAIDLPPLLPDDMTEK